jgi:HTH-type transcriptional regulator / antitoxin HigA
MATKRVWPDEAFPPGGTLAEEIAVRGMSQTDLARKMGRPIQVINEIVLGKKQITAETALQLEKALTGVSAEFWMRLEMDYQLTRMRLLLEGQAPRSTRRKRA